MTVHAHQLVEIILIIYVRKPTNWYYHDNIEYRVILSTWQSWPDYPHP